MKRFAILMEEVTSSTKTTAKTEALIKYFKEADEQDKVWTIALFTGRRPKRVVASSKLQAWAAEAAGLPMWLFEESYQNVGDLSETIALILPECTSEDERTLHYWIGFLMQLEGKTEEEKKAAILYAWSCLGSKERFIFNKLMSGAFRIGVSGGLVVNALAKVTGLSAQAVMHCITGNWNPAGVSWQQLLSDNHTVTDVSKPYPFYLAHPLEEDPLSLGECHEWMAEWKWDGIRGQLICRKGELFIWSRGEELVTDKFPELGVLKSFLPDGTVIDGEILCCKNNQPLPFQLLQTRIGRKNVTRKILETSPVVFMAYDLLEYNGMDVRDWSQYQRRQQLEKLHNTLTEHKDRLPISPLVTFQSWEELKRLRQCSREQGCEGLMLKHKQAVYQAGRRRGEWWKWKIEPYSIDAVLVAAQKGHGRRASLYTDYTFALRDNNGALVTFAKAYSGLTDKEIVEVDRIIRQNILEKFGPVRTVNPVLVFEIAFEGIAESKRHKSGVAVRFPRIVRWRKDKPVTEINTLDELRRLANL